jgi:hypothetical protein
MRRGTWRSRAEGLRKTEAEPELAVLTELKAERSANTAKDDPELESGDSKCG